MSSIDAIFNVIADYLDKTGDYDGVQEIADRTISFHRKHAGRVRKRNKIPTPRRRKITN